MWSKFDFNLQVVVFVFVVGATESLGTNASTSGSFKNSFNCTEQVHCRCPHGKHFAVTDVINCADRMDICVTHMKDHCSIKGITGYYRH